MNRRKLIIAISAMIAMTYAIVSTSYGYWTDQLHISGEAGFVFQIPVVNDVKMPLEIPLEGMSALVIETNSDEPETGIEPTEDIQPETTPETEEQTAPVAEEQTDPAIADEGDVETRPVTVDEKQPESTEAEGSATDESAELQ